MKKHFKLIALIIALTSFTIGCDDHDHDHEGELITTVTLTMVGSNNQTIVLTSRDLDGDGPNAPIVTITGGNFLNGVTYTGNIQFLNELEDPTEDITPEVIAEGTAHQVFYQLPSNLGAFVYTDADSNNRPIGITTTYTPANIGNGNLRVTLRHFPNKNATGVLQGNIANAGGETDVEVNFNITVSPNN